MRNVFIVAAILLVSAAAFAATNAPTGAWSFSGGDAEVGKMHKAVDVSVDEMNFAMRPFARPKLKKICAPWTKVKISVSGEDVSVTTDKGTLTSPLGKTVKRTIDGDEVKVKRYLEKGVLVANVWSDEGGRENRFQKVGDKLVVKSKVYSPRLPKAVNFQFTYSE